MGETRVILGLVVPACLWLGAAGCGGDEDDEDDWSDWERSCDAYPEHTVAAGTTWQWQLSGDIDTGIDVELYDIDLFEVSQSVIDGLHGDGRIVICYFSAGSWEEWRDDADDYPADAIGETLEGWDDEKWIDVRSDGVRAVLEARLDVAVDKGCDGVEPDNVDGYVNDSGFDFDGFDQLDFNAWLAEQAHARGLSVGLKNDVDQIEPLEPCFDWALNEECYAYGECDTYAPFLGAGKAVFHVEYVDDEADGPELADEVCGSADVAGFSTLIKEWDLYEWFIACD
jgi:endo-alpha-1,4-polygalactosaminidase (GH114 family)